MRRILLVLTAAALMAAMVLALAVPAFAEHKPPDTNHCTDEPVEGGFVQTCSGGTGYSEPGGIDNGVVGGQGGRLVTDCRPENPSYCEFTGSGGSGGQTTVEGGGIDSTGGSGYRCDPDGGCVGEGYTGGPAR